METTNITNIKVVKMSSAKVRLSGKRNKPESRIIRTEDLLNGNF